MWVVFALMTVITWGLYGAMLAKGAAEFGHDRMKAFLFVGVAYFVLSIISPDTARKVRERVGGGTA